MKPCSETKLAVNGGQPIRTTFLPYSRHWIDESDIHAVIEVLKSDWLTTGPKVKEFEDIFAAFVGAKDAVSFSSGTAALHAAVFAAGLTSGDEAITSPLTFSATANCIVYQKGKPVFADVFADSLNIDVEQIKAKITSKTKVLIPVDYAGQPADLDEICSMAKKHGLIVIEDAAHALGAIYKGKRVGSISDMTIFSMHPAKHITTGEGGMVTTNDSRFASRLRLFRNHGIPSEASERIKNKTWFYEMIDLGYNYRLSDIQCALGISQLQKLEGWLEKRLGIAKQYTEAFKDMELTTPTVSSDRQSAWHLYVVRLHLEKLKKDREAIFKAMQAENIGVNVHYIPVYWHPFYKKNFGFKAGLCPVAEKTYQQILSLPIFPGMKEQDIHDVIFTLQKVMEAYRQ